MTHPGGAVDLTAYLAWLFDLDGVLTDTAEVHAAAWKAAFDPILAVESASRGVPLVPFDPADDYLRFVDGRPRTDGVRTFLGARGIRLDEGRPGDRPAARTVAGVANGKNDLLLDILERDGVRVCSGAVNLLRTLRAGAVRTAVVSASENTRAVLRAGGIDGLMDICVDGIVVRQRGLAGKPAPDSYLEAARLLDVPPERAVVVEDALVGVEAGRSGGFGLVVGVDHRGQRDALVAHGADIVVGDLADLVP